MGGCDRRVTGATFFLVVRVSNIHLFLRRLIESVQYIPPGFKTVEAAMASTT
jgi:hypothetical protein